MDPGICFTEASLMNPVILAKLNRYAIVGIVTTAVYFGVGTTLQFFGLSINLLAFFSFTAAVIVNYIMQRLWVFVDSRPLAESLPRYICMVGIGYCMNGLTLMLLTPSASLLLAQFVALILIIASNAALSFWWVFCRK